jgi:hypothetical protein
VTVRDLREALQVLEPWRVHVASVSVCRAARRALRGVASATPDTLRAVGPGRMWTTDPAPDRLRGECLDGQVLTLGAPGVMRSTDGAVVEEGDTIAHVGPHGSGGALAERLRALGWEVV